MSLHSIRGIYSGHGNRDVASHVALSAFMLALLWAGLFELAPWVGGSTYYYLTYAVLFVAASIHADRHAHAEGRPGAVALSCAIVSVAALVLMVL